MCKSYVHFGLAKRRGSDDGGTRFDVVVVEPKTSSEDKRDKDTTVKVSESRCRSTIKIYLRQSTTVGRRVLGRSWSIILVSLIQGLRTDTGRSGTCPSGR